MIQDRLKENIAENLDPEGLETLEVIANADNFNRWMYETIKPFCGGRILEIGSGIGNISKYFIKDNATITLSDFRESYCTTLRENFSATSTPVTQMDLVHPDFNVAYAPLLNSFDTVFALNVVEHIEKDDQALRNCHALLKTGGQLIILVPAYQWLYCDFDVSLGHFRRYTRRMLNQRFVNANLEVKRSMYFNAVGTLGWLMSGKILRKKIIPGGQMKVFNKLVGIFKLVDAALLRSFGLSVISVGKK